MLNKYHSRNPGKFYVLQCGIFLLLLAITFSFLSEFFLSVENISNILTASAVIGLMALGATFVIGSGGIDLSTAAIMALSGVITAYFAQNFSLPPFTIIAIAGLVGAACGFANGWLINITGAPSFIITLGTLSLARAIAFIITDGTPIYGLPESITSIGQGEVLGISAPVLFLIIATMFCFYLLSYTRFGIHSLIMGDNINAARAMGIPVQTSRLKIYSLAGLLSGLAGFIYMARTNSGDPTAGQNYELIVITAAILGGANLFGGRAAIAGTVLGVLCLGVLQNGLNLLAIGTFYQILFVGLVLIVSAFMRRTGLRI
jgi:ribose/xylose/arabinose/galactoside ABC-type transport system permease subunit